MTFGHILNGMPMGLIRSNIFTFIALSVYPGNWHPKIKHHWLFWCMGAITCSAQPRNTA